MHKGDRAQAKVCTIQLSPNTINITHACENISGTPIFSFNNLYLSNLYYLILPLPFH